ncbi:uncharacterized protein F5147DRAFT_26782 [Suillus discolor]|uniref:Secreted protein n=1 Tax=Suillus discolor TaxID=1912936 RepID=A0A9P7EUQ9_9AGAM|nr:uncharacterized protein F5147DRAFT_26782 [Suillus discolor]KAG2090361.1 hypothetical protein F5147DRAFT_26782 [Suillus discolor]
MPIFRFHLILTLHLFTGAFNPVTTCEPPGWSHRTFMKHVASAHLLVAFVPRSCSFSMVLSSYNRSLSLSLYACSSPPPFTIFGQLSTFVGLPSSLYKPIVS